MNLIIILTLGQFQKPKNIAFCGTLDRGLTKNSIIHLFFPMGFLLPEGF
jgi:hypothetical protein